MKTLPCATDSQMWLVRKLIAERDILSLLEADRSLVRRVEAGHAISKRDASHLIDELKATALGQSVSDNGFSRRRSASGDDWTRDDAGVYLHDGTVYRVYYGQNSERMLVKKMVGERGNHSWEYLGLAARFVNRDWRVSLEEAKAWGRLTETCIRCGADLDVPESVERGIGPKCAKAF